MTKKRRSDQMTTDDHPRSGNNSSERGRGFVYTIFNLTSDQFKSIINNMEAKINWGQAGMEKCPSTGKDHIQGCIYFSTKRTFNQVRKLFKPAEIATDALQTMKGNREDNNAYTGKEDQIIWSYNMETKPQKLIEKKEIDDSWVLSNPLKDKEMLPWQQQLYDSIVPYKEDIRQVNWYWEPSGNCGKTWFTQMMVAEHGALLIEGQAEHVKFAIAKLKADGKPCPKYILLNVPKASNGSISYKVLEQIKDKMFFSTKYESGMITMKYSPTIVVFANQEPVLENLSLDRWNIVQIC